MCRVSQFFWCGGWVLVKSVGAPNMCVIRGDTFPDSAIRITATMPTFVKCARVTLGNGISLLGGPFHVASVTRCRSFFKKTPAPLFALRSTTSNRVPAIIYKAGGVITGHANMPFALCCRVLVFFTGNKKPYCVISMNSCAISDLSTSTFGTNVSALLGRRRPAVMLYPRTIGLGSGRLYCDIRATVLDRYKCGVHGHVAVLSMCSNCGSHESPRKSIMGRFHRGANDTFLSFKTTCCP